jgi:hypothetical protein
MAKRRSRRKSRFSKRGGRRNKLLSKGILVATGILVLILILLIGISSGLFEGPKEVVMYAINDECSLVMGNIIHQIRDNGDCRIRCVNECGLREKEIVKIEFELKNNSCHVCDCYCK